MSQMRAGLVGIVAGTEQVVLQMTAEGGDRRGVPMYVVCLLFVCFCCWSACAVRSMWDIHGALLLVPPQFPHLVQAGDAPVCVACRVVVGWR